MKGKKHTINCHNLVPASYHVKSLWMFQLIKGSYEHTNDEEKGLEKTCKRAILQQQREGGEHHQRGLHRNSSAEERRNNHTKQDIKEEDHTYVPP